MISMIESKLRPDAFYPSLDRVFFSGLYRRGFRLVLLDLDNTLSVHGSHQADQYARDCIKLIREAGFQCWIITNARRRRGEAYAASIPVPVIPMAGKPSAKAVYAACEESGISTQCTVLIGDQLFTDIWCARRAGCHAILVLPRDLKEAWNVRIKRWLEKPLYRRFRLNQPGISPKKSKNKWS